ncbi:uncharacterized protein PAC_06524 [Phialocephala subalpina]|uniref:Uncharacterized protein n=1 Tax=Phialocephala subalpina TaxID=576137 RepID=A0A1L7WV31_9HELO|nr:uncharacterized protein PAC_06524 [Phialocephala subalpina]
MEKELTPSQKNAASVLNAVARSPLRRDSRLNDVFFNQNETEWVPSTLFKPIRNLKIRRRLRTFAKAETSFSSVSLKTPLIVTVPQSESSITVDSPLSNPSSEPPIAKLESSSGSNIPSPQRSTNPNRRLRRQLLRRTCGKGRRAASRAANATTPYGQQQSSSVSKFSPKVPSSKLESISLEKSPLSPNQEELSKPPPPKATPGSYFRTGLGYPPESIPPTSTQADSSVSV